MARVDIGPEGGPFVELDEVDGEFVIRIPQDQLDFTGASFQNIANALLEGEGFDGQGTTNLTNLASVETDGAEIASSLGIPVYTDDANAPNGTQYFDDTDGQLEYKDADGVIFAGGGLEDGENFDGQGTSEFTNLASVSTDALASGNLQVDGQPLETTDEINFITE